MDKKQAIVTFTNSKVLPIRVEFPTNIGNYKTIEDAMKDIKLFNCVASFRPTDNKQK